MFHWYGFFIGIAVVVWWSLVAMIESKIEKVIPWVLFAALLGARVWHVADMWSYYSHNLSDIVRVWEGGLSIWGAIIVGGGVGVITKTLPILLTPLPLAQAIGRIGNGVNGEFTNLVWGIPWWGAEAILDLVLFAILWGPSLRGVSSQVKVGAYLVGYGLIRLVLQPYRL